MSSNQAYAHFAGNGTPEPSAPKVSWAAARDLSGAEVGLANIRRIASQVVINSAQTKLVSVQSALLKAPIHQFTRLDVDRRKRYRPVVVKVIERGSIRIYVYQEGGHRHHAEHCHIYWPDGSCVIDLDSLDLLEGVNPRRAAWDLLHDNISEIRAAWRLLNPRRSPK